MAKIKSKIKFDSKRHKYFDDKGREYISVTTLLSQMFPFDRNAIARRISQNPNSEYYKWPLKKIFKDWQDSAKHGNILHKACEDYVIYKKIPEDPILHHCVKQYAKLRFKGKILPEQKVFSEKHKIAGTADILEDYGSFIYLWDIKTCKKLDQSRKHKFSLQLEIYKRLIEETFGKPCKVGGIIFFEDYVKQGKKTKLTIHAADSVISEVNCILEERLKDLDIPNNS